MPTSSFHCQVHVHFQFLFPPTPDTMLVLFYSGCSIYDDTYLSLLFGDRDTQLTQAVSFNIDPTLNSGLLDRQRKRHYSHSDCHKSASSSSRSRWCRCDNHCIFDDHSLDVHCISVGRLLNTNDVYIPLAPSGPITPTNILQCHRSLRRFKTTHR